MSDFQRLLEEERSSRRTIADVIEVLHQTCNFNSHDRAEIHIGPLRLSSGDVVGLVDVHFPVRDKVFIVSLPTSARFRANCREVRGCFEIDRQWNRAIHETWLERSDDRGGVRMEPFRYVEFTLP